MNPRNVRAGQLAAAVGTGLALGGVEASAQSIPVVNAGFEAPAQSPNGFTATGITGWTLVGSFAGDWGVFYPTQATWGFVAPEGHQTAYTNGSTFEQTLTTLTAPNTTYTLQVDVVNRPNFGAHNYFIELYAGATLLCRDSNSLSPPVAEFRTSFLAYTTPASGPTVGQPLRIRLGGANQTNFDRVRFRPCYVNCDDSTATPLLNVQDFSCFLQQFASGSSYANCDSSTATPTLNVQDFSCFLQKFASGCS